MKKIIFSLLLTLSTSVLAGNSGNVNLNSKGWGPNLDNLVIHQAAGNPAPILFGFENMDSIQTVWMIGCDALQVLQAKLICKRAQGSDVLMGDVSPDSAMGDGDFGFARSYSRVKLSPSLNYDFSYRNQQYTMTLH